MHLVIGAVVSLPGANITGVGVMLPAECSDTFCSILGKSVGQELHLPAVFPFSYGFSYLFHYISYFFYHWEHAQHLKEGYDLVYIYSPPSFTCGKYFFLFLWLEMF